MSSASEPMDTGSPEGSPSTTASLPSALAIARAELARARCVSTELQKTFETLSREVEPDLEPDEEQPESDPQASLQLASLGIELATKEKEAIRLERVVVAQEQHAGILHPKEARKRVQTLNRRYFSAGDDKWRHLKKKIRLDDPGTVRLMDPRDNGLSECLLALYKKCDGLDRKRTRPSSWRQDALTYYSGSRLYKKQQQVWCHISGLWNASEDIKTAHIVPFFLDTESIGEMLFGSRTESLKRAGNALLLSGRIKGWFDSYHLVVVPIDPMETPITRWRTDVISSDIRNSLYFPGHTGKELDGKELVFLNDKRPVSRFLYFHFVMALVRLKDIKRNGWQDVWARYYTQRPFPTPGNYIRQGMLLALATHFGTADMDVVNSWIADHGFEPALKLTDDEVTEVARRVHLAVEDAVARAEKKNRSVEERSEDSSEERSEDSSEERSEDSSEERSEDSSEERSEDSSKTTRKKIWLQRIPG